MACNQIVRGSKRRPAILAASGLLITTLIAVATGGLATAASGPTVTGVSPDGGLVSGGTTVTVTGAGFTGATVVDFGTKPGLSPDVISDNSLTVTSPAESAGTVDVTVIAPGGTSPTSPVDTFTYVAAGPAPTITGVSPNSGLDGGGTLVTITGTGFTGTTAVTFGPAAATSIVVVSDTTLTVTTPPYLAETAVVTVETPNGSATSTFTFVSSGPPPTITAVTPDTGLTSGTVVTITGTGFTGANFVDFGTEPAALFLVSSSTSIIAQSPVQAAGIVDVTVTTPNGTSATSAADQFTAVTPGPPPVVTAVTPNAGTTAGGVSFTINGTGFTGAGAVHVGTVAVPFVTNSDTSITATSVVQPAGTYDVTVATPNGPSATGTADQFTVTAPVPVVTGVSPPSDTTDGGTPVTISGSGLTFATAVSFGGTPATSFTVDSDTSITATSPPEAAGTVDLTVTTAGGASATSAADQYTFVTPPLVVTGLSPTAGSTAGGTLVTISGSDFTGATAVDFGTVSAAFVFHTDEVITALSPPEAAGNVNVTIITPTGTTTPATRHADRYSFVTPPQVVRVSPPSGPALGGTTVTVRGKRFTDVTAVDFGAVPAPTFTVDSSGSITATTPQALPGLVQVTVITAIGTSVNSMSDQYTYTTPPPAVTGLSVPGQTVAGGSTLGGTPVTITGTGFTGAYAVGFGSTPATGIVVKNDTTVLATSPPGVVGVVNVSVTTPVGTSRKSPADQFTYIMRVTTPVVTGVSPHAGLTSTKVPKSGETSITITGTGFTGATSVDFGTTPALTMGLISDTEITATSPQVPASAAGTVDVTVTTPDGTSATGAADLFTFVAPGPLSRVTGVSPTSGPDTGGTNVIITGSGLSGATAVDFGTVSVPFALDEDTGELVATSPAESVGTVDVTVTTPNGVSVTTSSDRFTFTTPQIPPTVTVIRPHKGPATGGTKVVIVGTGFVGTAGVEFGDMPVNFVVNSNHSITVMSPAESPAIVDVTVTTPNGTSATGPGDQFTFETPR